MEAGIRVGGLVSHGGTSGFVRVPPRKRRASIVEAMRRLAILVLPPGFLAASEPAPKPADIDGLGSPRRGFDGRARSFRPDRSRDRGLSRRSRRGAGFARGALAPHARALLQGRAHDGRSRREAAIFDEGRTVAEQALAILRREAGREAARISPSATPVELVPHVRETRRPSRRSFGPPWTGEWVSPSGRPRR